MDIDIILVCWWQDTVTNQGPALGRRNVTFAEASKKPCKACATKATQNKAFTAHKKHLFSSISRKKTKNYKVVVLSSFSINLGLASN